MPAFVRGLRLAVLLVPLLPHAAARAEDDEERRVDAVAFAANLEAGADPQAESLLRFYQSREYRPAWITRGRLSRQGAALLRLLRDADREGLEPERYWHAVFDAAGAADSAGLGEIEQRLTDALLRYVSDVAQGRFDPAASNPYWAQRPQAVDAGAILREAVESKDAEKALRGLLPRNPQYAALRGALARHRAIASRGGWTALPPPLRLRPGQRSPYVAALRARLLAGGDLHEPITAARAAAFDEALASALKRFESRHGLKADGVLDRETVAALNVPVEDRIRQIELNLERWRWLSPSPSDRFILVNIPGFELHAFDRGQPVLRMRVVTGNAARTPTPVFSRTMTHVVFRPYWNVPTSIAEAEIMPAVLRDRGYLRRRNLELLRGDGGMQLRQRPGPGNALGLVKFLLPNPFSIYLHDTPEGGLFARARRDGSHGCVRVERPFELARLVLAGDPQWTPGRIRAAMDAGTEQHVALPEPLPVFITYLTVWADADGVTRFYPDVYEHDAAQQALLTRSAAPPATRAAGS